MYKICYALIISAILFTSGVFAQIPRHMSYQGILTDSQGNVKPDGSYVMGFSLYTTAAGGQPVWSETKTVEATDGLFYTILGTNNPIGPAVDFSSEYWLGITLEGESEMAPRIKLTSAPYSFSSINADTADFAKSAYTARPISPGINKNEIRNNTVVRELRIYPLPLSDSVSIMQDTVFLVSGPGIAIRQDGDSVIIKSNTETDSLGNTLDEAYAEGGRGKGRLITADNGSVEIDGKDGLIVSGTNNVITAGTDSEISTGFFINNSTSGHAIEGAIPNQNADLSAIYGVTTGTITSSAVQGLSYGEGAGGFFEIQNPDNTKPAVLGQTNGKGNGGWFENISDNNTEPALVAVNYGKGNSGFFEIKNSGSSEASLEATTQGLGQALKAYINNEESNAAEIRVLNDKNRMAAVYAEILGNGNGVYAISEEAASTVAPAKAGAYGTSKPNYGIVGLSDERSGVYGATGVSHSFRLLTFNIEAGVKGATNNSQSADNFGVAGIATGYGTGVLGIGSGSGHGVFGVSGRETSFTSAGVRGVTLEDSTLGESWPPYFYVEEGAPYSKDIVGVLGQSYTKYGVWGESVQKYGVIGTTGKRTGLSDIPNDSAAVLALAFEGKAMGLIAKSDNGPAAEFTAVKSGNQSDAVKIHNSGAGRGLVVNNYNTSNDTTVLAVSHLGPGRGCEISTFHSTSTESTFLATQHGLGRAGGFQISNSNNPSISIYGSTQGLGRVAEFNNFNSSNSAIALYVSTKGTGNGGYFIVDNASSNAAGVTIVNKGNGDALIASNQGGGRAASFGGDVAVNGMLSKSGGNFRIDHPLAPENKYLNHSFVESPDMKNIYDGTVLLNESGKAEITLPDWFEALNKDFRYQLTAIGAPGPGLYIENEISGNSFTIAGGAPGMKVSWQITGIRKDPWANANRIEVEVEKRPDEKGKYLHPELYGSGPEKNVLHSAEQSAENIDSYDTGINRAKGEK